MIDRLPPPIFPSRQLQFDRGRQRIFELRGFDRFRSETSHTSDETLQSLPHARRDELGLKLCVVRVKSRTKFLERNPSRAWS